MGPLARAVAVALGVTNASTGLAQTTEGAASEDGDDIQIMEEVVSLGIRGSLESARNLKRDSQGVVDGIVAEDIGKFPDTNLAESLQRIPGVSIDRSSIGEGQRITVRGIGPDFNLVLLNGRQMPASGIEDTAASNSRAFDFSNLASEAISAVEVFKTSRSNIPTGGIGATVNIKTARPLDNNERVLNFSARGVVDTSVEEGDSVTPEISGIYSDQFADGKFGVAISGSYQDRNLGFNQAGVPNGWRPFNGDDVSWGTIPLAGEPGSENITNRPAADDVYSVPQNLVYSFNDVQRERINGQLALQFKPVESVVATLDYTYSENEIATQRSELSAWFNYGPSVSTWTDGPVAAPLVYSETIDPANSDLGLGAAEFATKSENNSLGFNLRWDPFDRAGFEVDYHDSDAETGANSPLGSNSVIGAAAFIRGTTTADFSGDFPILSVDLPPGQDVIDPSQVLTTGRSFRNSFMRSEIEQLNLKGDLLFKDDMRLDFGVTLTDVKNRSAFANVQTDTWGGFGTPEDYDDAAFELARVAPLFSSMPGNNNANLFPNFFEWDFDQVRADGIAVAGSDETFMATDTFQEDRLTEEDTVSAYFQYSTGFYLGNATGNLALGLRYEQTDVMSSALVPIATGIEWSAANEFTVLFGDPDFTSLEGDYDYWLPSVDFNIEPVEDVVFRASYSQTIGRPGWGDIQGGQTLNQLARIDGGLGRQGDPGLLPLESDNLDFSVEWYYGNFSYVSLGYFRKKVDNYVGISTITDTPFNLPHPGQGARFAEAAAAVGDENDLVAIRNYIFENFADTPEVTVTGTDVNGNLTGTILGIAGEDPAATFEITVPANQRSATIDGWELVFQQMLFDTGFGFSVNLTLVDSNLAYDNADLGEQFAIEGLSDSANVVAFYENDKWGARVAYNWRDEFLSARFDGSGLPNPVYTEAYGQVDANVSYNVNDRLTVFAEGINITDEIQRLHGRNDRQTVFITQTGARYFFGARYNFN